ncbi:hypothetical protein CEXT_600781 [Caerostris extrusa]|uniref:Uncharacterized protein n=1 Tax=Caerostris extrusa TaxID=172846 RepID=A0AAV4R706_CAEEX|nr:hypothetical protein CEXT_600781 [Caerostris extrusa]
MMMEIGFDSRSHTSLLFPGHLLDKDSSANKSRSLFPLSCDGIFARLDESETCIKDESMVWQGSLVSRSFGFQFKDVGSVNILS